MTETDAYFVANMVPQDVTGSPGAVVALTVPQYNRLLRLATRGAAVRIPPMAEIHIPDEVVEAGVRKFIAFYHPEPADTPVSQWVTGEWVKVGPMWKVEFAEPFRAALTAALAEWVKTGMATRLHSPDQIVIRTEAP